MRHLAHDGNVVVDPHAAGPDLALSSHAAIDVTAPDGGGQSESRVVGEGDAGRVIVEGQRHQHRSEDLVLHDLRMLECPGDQCRRVERALRQVTLGYVSARDDRGPVGARSIDEPRHSVSLGQGDERTEVGLRVSGVAHADAGEEICDAGNHLVIERALDVDAGGGCAVLPGIDERAGNRSVDHGFDVGIVVDEEGSLAPELEVDSGSALRRDLHDPPSNVRGAGEGHHGHVRVTDERLAGDRAATYDDVDHSRGDAGGGCILGKHERGQGRDLRRFEHDGVARGNGREHLPHGHLEGVVPGGDGTDHAHRLATDDRRVGRVVLPRRKSLCLAGRAREEDHVVDGSRHVELGREPHGLAGLARLDLGVFAGSIFDESREPEQGGTAFARGRRRPSGEGRAGRGDGLIDLGCAR